MADKLVAKTQLQYFKTKLDTANDAKYVAKESGKGLSTNDYTTPEKTKLAGIQEGANKTVVDESLNKESTNPVQNKAIATKLEEITSQGGEPNTIETIKVNGSPLEPDGSKAVDITVPTKVSQLTNDSGYQTAENVEQTLTSKNYATKSDISSVYKYKGSVSTYAELPSSDQQVGDVYNVETADASHKIKAGDNVAWNGEDWDVLSGTVDLSNYYDMTNYPLCTNQDIDEMFA